MANVSLPVAGFVPNGIRNNKFPRITLSTVEQGLIFNCGWALGARMTISLMPTGTTLLIHSVSGQTQTDGAQIAAGGSLTLVVQNGDILYISGVGAGSLDILQVDT